MNLFKQFSFWTKLKLFFGSFGIGSEVALHFGDAHPVWRYVVGGATILAITITYFIEDKNNNNIVDAFENNGKTKKA
jgi:hypothetical protein